MYADALFQDRHRACGVDLLPMTLGHALLLQRLGSPFAGQRPALGEKRPDISFSDILLVAFVCSRNWRSAARAVNRRRSAWWLRWKWVTRRWHISRDTMAFFAWHSVQWRSPSFSANVSDASGLERGAEWVHILTVFCCRNMGCSHSEALDVPLPVATLDYLVFQEEQGAIRINEARDNDLESLALAAAEEAKQPSENPKTKI